jgi:hypothetical protein
MPQASHSEKYLPALTPKVTRAKPLYGEPTTSPAKQVHTQTTTQSQSMPLRCNRGGGWLFFAPARLFCAAKLACNANQQCTKM